MSRNDSHSPVGAVAARAAYDLGDPWLASLVERLDQQRALLGELLAAHLPEVRMRPLEATYLAWLDASAYGHDDAAAVALERGRVQVSPGESYAPGTTGQVRLNIATSPDRLTQIVERLAKAWTIALRLLLRRPLVEEGRSPVTKPAASTDEGPTLALTRSSLAPRTSNVEVSGLARAG